MDLSGYRTYWDRANHWGPEGPNEAEQEARYRGKGVSVAIGIRADGRLATLEGTPERRQQEWVLWEPGVRGG